MERGRATGFSFKVWWVYQIMCRFKGRREAYYCREHNISTEDFLKLDEQYEILNYVAECPDVFDSLTDSEMVREVGRYVSQP